MRWAVLALAVFVWGCGGAVAAEGPHDPPYPEVWGREMPWPSHVREWQAVSVHERGDGEILIAFRDHDFLPDEPTDDIEESGVLEFFGGTLSMETDAFNAAITYPQMTDRPFDLYKTFVELPGGVSVFNTWRDRTDEELCPRSIGPALASHIRSPADPKKLKKAYAKLVLAVLDRQHFREIDLPPHCRKSDAPPPEAGPYVERVISLRFFLHVLRDGTILAIGRERPVAIRFRTDLSSPFFATTERFFGIDRATVDDIIDGSFDPVRIRDVVERYIEKIKSERKSK